KSRCDLAVEYSGILVLIGTEIKDGEKVSARDMVKLEVGSEAKSFRRLRAGDKVEKGQLVAMLDDRLARDDVAVKESKVEAAEAFCLVAEKTRDEAKKRL